MVNMTDWDSPSDNFSNFDSINSNFDNTDDQSFFSDGIDESDHSDCPVLLKGMRTTSAPFLRK
jgi:hypothetical protein